MSSHSRKKIMRLWAWLVGSQHTTKRTIYLPWHPIGLQKGKIRAFCSRRRRSACGWLLEIAKFICEWQDVGNVYFLFQWPIFLSCQRLDIGDLCWLELWVSPRVLAAAFGLERGSIIIFRKKLLLPFECVALWSL